MRGDPEPAILLFFPVVFNFEDYAFQMQWRTISTPKQAIQRLMLGLLARLRPYDYSILVNHMNMTLLFHNSMQIILPQADAKNIDTVIWPQLNNTPCRLWLDEQSLFSSENITSLSHDEEGTLPTLPFSIFSKLAIPQALLSHSF